VIGISGGALLARFLLDTVSRTITNLYVLVGVGEVPFSFMEALVMTIVSIIVSMASAYFPARQAAKLEPREVIYQRPGLIGVEFKPENLYGGLGLIGLAGLLTAARWHNWPIGGFSATCLTLDFLFYV
jgi:hypothetical protein